MNNSKNIRKLCLLLILFSACQKKVPDSNFQQAEKYKTKGFWREALIEYSKVESNDAHVDSMLKMYLGMSNCYAGLNNLDSLHRILQVATDVEQHFPNPYYRFRILNQKGYAFTAEGKLTEAKDALEQALKVYQYENLRANVQNQDEYVSTCMNYSNVLTRIGIHLDKAVEYAHRANRWMDVTDTLNYIGSFNTLANAYQNNNQLDSAIIYYNNCIEKCLEYGYSMPIPYIHNNIGTVYANQKMYDKALEHLHKALIIDSTYNNEQNLILDYGNIGHVNNSLKNFSQAKYYLDKSIRQAVKMKSIEKEATARINYARMLTDLKQFKRASSMYPKIDSLLKVSNAKWVHTTYLIDQGNHFAALGKNQLAEKRFNQAKDTAQKLGQTTKQILALNQIAGILIKQGKYKNAIMHKDQASMLQDSLKVMSNEKKIAQLQASYDNNRKNNEILELKLAENNSKAAAMEQKQRKKRWIYLGLFMTFGCLGIGLLYRQKNKHNRKLVIKHDLIQNQKHRIESQYEDLKSMNEIIKNQHKELQKAKEDLDLSYEKERAFNALHFRLKGNLIFENKGQTFQYPYEDIKSFETDPSSKNTILLNRNHGLPTVSLKGMSLKDVDAIVPKYAFGRPNRICFVNFVHVKIKNGYITIGSEQIEITSSYKSEFNRRWEDYKKLNI